MLRKQKKTIFKFIFLASIFCLGFFLRPENTYAKLINIEGTIVDGSGNRIPNARVYYNDSADPASTTNEEGRYSIWIDVAEGTRASITYQADGYAIDKLESQVAEYVDNRPDKSSVDFIYNIDSSQRDIYENLISKKLDQTLGQLGKTINNKKLNDPYDGNIQDMAINYFEVRTSIDNVFISNIAEGDTSGVITWLTDKKNKRHAWYDIFLIPYNDTARSMLENAHITKKNLKKILPVITETDYLGATKILENLYDGDGMINRNWKDRKQLEATDGRIEVELNEDMQINVAVKGDDIDPTPMVSSGEVKLTQTIKRFKLDGTECTPTFDDRFAGIRVVIKKQSDPNDAKVVIPTLKIPDSAISIALDPEETYYLEYQFQENAWNQGYSTQEYDVTTTNSNDSQNGNYSYERNAYLDPSLPSVDLTNGIDYSKEQELNEYDHTKIIARTDPFTIKRWTTLDADGQEETHWSEIHTYLTLQERKDCDISVEKKVNAVKVVLSDGTEYWKEAKGENGIVWNLDGNTSTDRDDLREKIIFMDDEIMHGATVYVEYLITVKNDGDTENNEVTIVDYLDNQEGMYLLYDASGSLITNKTPDANGNLSEDGKTTNDDFKDIGVWEVVNKDQLSAYGNALSKLTHANNFIKTTIQLNPHETKSMKLVTSQVITTDTDPLYQNTIQMIHYKNAQGQRNGKWNTDFARSYRRLGTDQTASTSGKITILPPFGGTWFDKIKTKDMKLIYQTNDVVVKNNGSSNRNDIKMK